MTKEVQLYVEKYKKHAAVILDDMKPILRHQVPGFRCVRAEVRSAGVCELDGERLEFQDIRVYLKGEPI